MIPRDPVVFVDTGLSRARDVSLRRGADALLRSNVRRYAGSMTPAEMEAQHGKLWETDLDEYHRIRKVEPMRRAIKELDAHAWIAGCAPTRRRFAARSIP
jgi:phosphoadenosine phosphosulfate reductase